MTATTLLRTRPQPRPAGAPARFRTPDTEGETFAPQVLQVLSEMGRYRIRQPWRAQQWLQDSLPEALRVNDDGSWRYQDVVVHVPRRAGKTTVAGPVAGHRCQALPGAQVWVTAQTRGYAADIVCREWGEPAEAAYGAKVLRGAGQESVRIGTGLIRPFAPSDDGLHGREGDLVMVDEVWAMGAGVGLVQAIRPTLATTGGQAWWLSTAGDSSSGLLRNLVRQGVAGAEGVCLIDYGLPPEVALEVEEMLHDGNHEAAVDATLPWHPGEQVPRHALLTDARMMEPDQWLRAYGNVESSTVKGMITAVRWAQRRWQSHAGAPWPQPSKPLYLGVAADPVGGAAAIAAAWRHSNGSVLLDVLETAEGTDWLPPAVVRWSEQLRPRRIAVDRGDPAAASVETAILAHGLPRSRVDEQSANEYALGCGRFVDAVTSGEISHPDDPRLTQAVLDGQPRQLGDRWVWDRRAAAVSPLVAVTVALRSLERTRQQPGPEAVG